MLCWTLRALTAAKVLLEEDSLELGECVIAARPEEFLLIQEILKSEDFPFCVHLIEGGTTRQQSVHNAVKIARGSWVMVHDAARPLASPQLFRGVCSKALCRGAAIAALPASDTVKCADKSTLDPAIKSTFDRRYIWLAQTPQVFAKDTFLQALELADQEDFEGTDCSSLMERQGHSVALVPGETRNFKITYREDLARATMLLEQNIL